MNYQELIEKLKDKPDLIHDLSPRQFEELVAELIASLGWNVSLTSMTRDGGYDVFATRKDFLGEITSVVEVKKYRPDRPVGVDIVRELYGVKHLLNVSQSIVVTSSYFTKGARDFEQSRYDINLIDCEQVQNWINSFVPPEKGKEYSITRNFYSCFISYSHKDEEFAKYLNEKLRDQNIKVWYAPEDISPGQKIHEEIDNAIKIFDKLLIILSKESMQSEWVKTEIRKARKRELNEGRRVLFPISITEFDKIKNWELFDSDSGKDLAIEIREYLIPDFSKWKNSDEFKIGFEKLLKGLKTE